MDEISTYLVQTMPDKEKFLSGEFYYKAFDENRKLYVPYRLTGVKQASLVGTAFDYLARFEVAKVTSDKDCRTLIAEKAIPKLWELGYKQECRDAQKLYEWSLYVIDEYIHEKGNHSEHKMIDICQFLAILEHIVRDNTLDEIHMIGQKACSDIRYELLGLIDAFKKYFVSSYIDKNSRVVYNPTFTCCRYADADIWVDGCLYDFKTTKNIGYNENEVKQLWWYVLLHAIDKKHIALGTFQSYDIDSMALYKARCADVDKVKLNKEYVNNCANELEQLLRKHGLYREI